MAVQLVVLVVAAAVGQVPSLLVVLELQVMVEVLVVMVLTQVVVQELMELPTLVVVEEDMVEVFLEDPIPQSNLLVDQVLSSLLIQPHK
jgi:hypothetical protein